jgi:hypothetical protein
MVTYEVNEALAMSAGLAGKTVRVRGLLSFAFENVSLNHVAFAEREPGYASSIWLELGDGSGVLGVSACEKWHGKVVVVEGTLALPDPKFRGCGHLSLWRAELVARKIERAPNA